MMNKRKNRILSGFLAGVMILNQIPVFALAEDSAVCEHHTEHINCGYREAVPGNPCAHEHTDCYVLVEACIHSHDGCGYSEIPEENLCTHVCTEDSGCITAEFSCPHTHDSICGYSEDIPEQPCDYICMECVTQPQPVPDPTEGAIPDPTVSTTGPVAAKPVRWISLETMPTIQYVVNQDALDVSFGTLRVYYEDDTEEVIPMTPDMVSGFDNSVLGRQWLTVSYGGRTCGYEIAVVDSVHSSIAMEIWMESMPEKLVYYPGEPVDTTGAVLGVRYSNGIIETVPVTPDMVLNFTSDTTGRFTYEIYCPNANMGVLIEYHVITAQLLEGSCGPDAFWKFDPNGRLDIWGSGEITESFNADEGGDYPWTPYRDQITSVYIAAGITVIPAAAFQEMTALVFVSLPETLTEIGRYAFANCGALTQIRIPKSVSVIGMRAFNLCASLDYVHLFSGLTEIGEQAFGGCSSLWTMNLPNSLTKIGKSVFSNCTSLYSVTLPSTLKEIPEGAFLNCPNLTEIRFPEGLTDIGICAFTKCSGLTKLELPQSLTKIDAWAFSDCTALTELVLPENLTFLGQMAFQNCVSLDTVLFQGKSPDSWGTKYFDGVTATAYYSAGKTFAQPFMQNSGGSIDWRPIGKTINSLNIIYSGFEPVVPGEVFRVYGDIMPSLTNDVVYSLEWSWDPYCLEMVSSDKNNVTFRALWPGYTKITVTDTVSGLSDSMYLDIADPMPIDCPFEEQIMIYAHGDGGVYLFTPEETKQYAITLENVDNPNYGMCTSVSVTRESDHFAVPSDTIQFLPAETRGFYTLKAGVSYIIRPEYRGESYMSDVIFRLEPVAELTGIDIPEETLTFYLCDEKYIFSDDTVVGVNCFPSNAIGTVSWYSSDPEIVSVVSGGNKCTLQANKVGTAVITAVIGSYSDSVIVTVKLPEPLSLNVRHTDVCVSGYGKYYSFTAPEDGTYTFAMDPRNDFWFQVSNSIATPGEQRFIQSMKAGEMCYLYVDDRKQYSDSAEYTVYVSKTRWAEELYLDVYENESNHMVIAASFSPWDAEDVITQFVFSDETKLWPGAGDPGYRYCQILEPGEVTVTVTSLGGLTASVTLGRTEGSCGENAYWTFDPATGVLTISGTGDINNMESLVDGWRYYRNYISRIVVEEGITGIASHAFQEFEKLRSVKLPGTLKSIGYNAFGSCYNLTALTLPEGLEYVDDFAFQYCGFTSVSIPLSLTHAGTASFRSENLTDVFYPGTHTQWSSIELENECGLLRADVHYGVSDGTEKVSWSFDKTTGTLTVSGTGRMEHFNAYESPWESVLEQIRSVVLKNGLTSIGHNAFYGCNNLKEVTIPASVVYIGEYALATWGDQLTICYGSTEQAWDNIWYEYNGGYVESARVLFEEYSGICGTNAVWTFEKETGTLTVSGSGRMRDYGWNDMPWVGLRDRIRAVVVHEGITSIGNNAFRSCAGLETVSLPETLGKIGGAAFLGCGALETVEIPAAVTSIGDSAFAYSGIHEILISAKVRSLGEETFACCPNLRAVTVEEGNAVCLSENGVLFDREKTRLIHYPAMKDSRDYTVPESVGRIENYAFYENGILEEVQLPDGLEFIGYAAFCGNTALKQIRIPDSVTVIEYSAFDGCTSLERAVVGRGIENLTLNVFSGCTSLTDVVLPDTLVNIWEFTFGSCTSLKRIVLPSNMNFISDGAFDGCSALEEVVIGGVSEIWWSFSGCDRLEKIYFLGDAPEYVSDTFEDKTLKIYYPGLNPTWTETFRNSVRGNITWIPQYDTEEVLRIDTDSLVLLPGETATLTALMSTEAAPEGKILWNLGEGDSAYVALKTNPDGTATITAKKNTQYRQITVTAVAEKGILEPAVIHMDVLPLVSNVRILSADGTDIAGTTQPLYLGSNSDNAMVLSAENAPVDALQEVEWKSSNTTYAEVNENGIVIGKVPGKTVTITATAADGSGKRATVNIKLIQPMEELTLPESASVAGGKSVALNAEIFPETTTNPALVWEILDGKEFATISSGGKLKAKKVDRTETVTVRVSAKENPELYAECSVEIYPAVTKVSIFDENGTVVSGTTQTMYLYSYTGNTMQLSAANDPEDSAQEWIWSSTAPNWVSVDEAGEVTAYEAGKTATVIAMATDGSGKKASVRIRTVQPVEDIVLSGPATVAKGKSIKLTAEIWPENATNQKLVWEIVEGAEYASVSSGTVKARTNFSEMRTVTVRVSAAEDREMCAYYTVTLNPVAASTVQILDASGSVITNTKQTVNMSVYWDNTLELYAQVGAEGACQDVIWTSSDTKYATVDEYGTVTLLAPGKTVTVTATATDGSGKKASVKLTGNQPVELLALKEDMITDAFGSIFIAGGKTLKLAEYVGVYPENASNRSLKWTVDANAYGIQINAKSGTLSTRKVSEMVTVWVCAEAQDGSGQQIRFSVNIYPATTKLQLLTGNMDVTGKTLTATVGDVVDLTAQNVPENSAPIYIWKSSSTNLAEVDNGVVTIGDISGKTVTIQCTAADGSGKSATVKIEIV